jgi:hypothetical protein
MAEILGLAGDALVILLSLSCGISAFAGMAAGA